MIDCIGTSSCAECGVRCTDSNLRWCGISPPAVLGCFILFGNISKLTVTLPKVSPLLLFGVGN